MPRSLTYDEKKAAEAAFLGKPCDPTWSASAKTIYDGITKAKAERQVEPEPVLNDEQLVSSGR